MKIFYGFALEELLLWTEQAIEKRYFKVLNIKAESSTRKRWKISELYFEPTSALQGLILFSDLKRILKKYMSAM